MEIVNTFLDIWWGSKGLKYLCYLDMSYLFQFSLAKQLSNIIWYQQICINGILFSRSHEFAFRISLLWRFSNVCPVRFYWFNLLFFKCLRLCILRGKNWWNACFRSFIIFYVAYSSSHFKSFCLHCKSFRFNFAW